jgi:putative intracellular protease/amidase
MRILIPVPANDFDPTEVALSWQILLAAGHTLHFATPDGKRGYADPLMLSGAGLDAWGWIPGLKKLRLLGLLLRARADAREAYRRLERDTHFLAPTPYAAVRTEDFDALLLPGGHAPGMRVYLQNATLQARVAEFFDADKPVAAICHGVLLAARSVSKHTGKSVLHGRQTTALTWRLERAAWQLAKFYARFWDSGYYRTYGELANQPVGYMSVQAEVTRLLARPEDFHDVAPGAPHYFAKSSGIFRDSASDSSPAFVLRDGNYVSARWPGDVHLFAKTFAALLAQQN